MSSLIGRIVKAIWLTIRGALWGYLAYVPVLTVAEVLEYGRVDGEHFFYRLFNPLLFPYLIWPAFWREFRWHDLFLVIAGTSLFALGIFFSFWRDSKAKFKNDEHVTLGL